MNLFVLDFNPTVAARYNCDKHVVKIILEAVEMMGYTYDSGKNFEPLPWLGEKGRHLNHPMSKWVRASAANFHWTLMHAKALCSEYTNRYNKIHSYAKNVSWIFNHPPEMYLEPGSLTDWPRCFGEYKTVIPITESAVADYREYYKIAKSKFAVWRNGNIPEWFKNEN